MSAGAAGAGRSRQRAQALARHALGPLLLVWLGVAIGVTLLAAPAPFLAEGLSRGEALAVNRELFRRFASTELGLLAVLVLIAWATRPTRLTWVGLGGLALIVLVEGFLLLPDLVRRTDLVLRDITPEPSPVHAIYVALELLKMVLLGALALAARPPSRG